MRICEGNYAYEIEQALDPETRVSKGWRVNVYRVRPQDQLLRSGVASTKEEAERAGKQVVREVMNEEQRNIDSTRRSAA